MDTTELRTARLRLRPFVSADVPAIHAACQDAEIQRWTTVPSPYALSDAENFVETLCPKQWAENTAFTFGVFTEDAQRSLVGAMGLMAHEPGRLEIGFWTAAEQRGRGYTAEAARAVCDWAFTELRAWRVEWLAVAGNQGSRAVAEKAGFVFEGTLRGGRLHRRTPTDMWIAGLLPGDRSR
ncbi:hypothetical protein BIV57_10230 [Mangrovactinospora gilvigrisea]|uniref:N-acetyltransferase domain-containing protein n=1 Tax=Mangrovactinospora gilvigrisea TaxID=1428644 RepID=A0A1J7BG68_9ACTN|nr:GNAT family N-acetyltransferase [Mangrovactinospora gilvigrisea]OIV37573.1 hypothetical protein BIV57_10230 [Mangrovactinospora gilvigrisea]